MPVTHPRASGSPRGHFPACPPGLHWLSNPAAPSDPGSHSPVPLGNMNKSKPDTWSPAHLTPTRQQQAGQVGTFLFNVHQWESVPLSPPTGVVGDSLLDQYQERWRRKSAHLLPCGGSWQPREALPFSFLTGHGVGIWTSTPTQGGMGHPSFTQFERKGGYWRGRSWRKRLFNAAREVLGRHLTMQTWTDRISQSVKPGLQCQSHAVFSVSSKQSTNEAAQSTTPRMLKTKLSWE